MRMFKGEIPIFFTIDERFVPYVDCAIMSILDNSSKEYKYKIHILYENLKKEDIKKISRLECENCEINFKEMKDGMELITNRVENKLRCDYFTLTIFFRIFIAELFPEYDKGIYIDSDVIVPGDISELYNKDLKGNLIGASIDHSIQKIPEFIKYVENCDGIPGKQYINSGILLMNLKQMREKKFVKRFLELLSTYHFDSIAPDQDYINAICHDKILYLDEEWDAMPAEGKEELKNPKLIHYNLFSKPWHYDKIQYEEYFWEYAKQSVFYNEILDEKKNYSEAQKRLDSETIGTMLKKALELAETDKPTFRKVYEKGEKVRL